MLVITVLAFAHHKGGTGKTTSCLNVAGFLQKDGEKILVVDCDPQANATTGLGIDPGILEVSTYDVFMSAVRGFPDTAIEDTLIRTPSGVDLVPATLDLVGAEPYLYGVEDRAWVLYNALVEVKDAYDFILIDTPPSMGQFAINALVAADNTIVTLDPGTFALKSMEALSTVFDDIHEVLGEEVIADMAILTRWKDSGGQSAKGGGLAHFLKSIFSPGPTMEEEAEKRRFDEFENEVKEIFRQVFTVPYSPAICEAQQRGLPISHYAPDCDAGKGYRAIATAILKLNDNDKRM